MTSETISTEVRTRLQQLRDALEQARSMPMSASAVVNRSEVLELVAQLERSISGAFTDAGELLGEREAVVAAARGEADEILRAARSESERLVGETNVYQVAAARAAELDESSRARAEQLREETDKYVEEKLANFEITLERTLDVVRRGRARINDGVVHGLADDTDVDDLALPDHLEG